MTALFEDEDSEGLDAILARGLPAFDEAAHVARVRAACACAGCDAARGRLAAGLPPAGRTTRIYAFGSQRARACAPVLGGASRSILPHIL